MYAHMEPVLPPQPAASAHRRCGWTHSCPSCSVPLDTEPTDRCHHCCGLRLNHTALTYAGVLTFSPNGTSQILLLYIPTTQPALPERKPLNKMDWGEPSKLHLPMAGGSHSVIKITLARNCTVQCSSAWVATYYAQKPYSQHRSWWSWMWLK